MVKLSAKDRRIAKEHLKGRKSKDIGAAEYPNANPNSQAVLVSRTLKKRHVAQYIEQGKLQTLKEFNVTWKSIIEPRVDALNATKLDQYTGELLPDHNVRLKGAKDLEGMLESKSINEETQELIKDLPNVDEIQLVRLMKTK